MEGQADGRLHLLRKRTSDKPWGFDSPSFRHTCYVPFVARTLGFEAWEVTGEVLVDFTQCPECKTFVHFNGLPPRYCPQGHEITTEPVMPAGGSHGTRTRLPKASDPPG